MELQKREDEMRQMFVQRVKEKESELKEAEREVSGKTQRKQGSVHVVPALRRLKYPPHLTVSHGSGLTAELNCWFLAEVVRCQSFFFFFCQMKVEKKSICLHFHI